MPLALTNAFIPSRVGECFTTLKATKAPDYFGVRFSLKKSAPDKIPDRSDFGNETAGTLNFHIP